MKDIDTLVKHYKDKILNAGMINTKSASNLGGRSDKAVRPNDPSITPGPPRPPQATPSTMPSWPVCMQDSSETTQATVRKAKTSAVLVLSPSCAVGVMPQPQSEAWNMLTGDSILSGRDGSTIKARIKDLA